MKIGEIASQTNCNIETIRYYEKINLLPVPIRSGNGYRNYSEDHIKRLRFIRRCRELGFSIEEIRALIRLVDSHDYTCNDVRMIAMEHIADIRRKIADLKNLEKTLSQISAQCSGDSTPECAILEALFDNKK